MPVPTALPSRSLLPCSPRGAVRAALGAWVWQTVGGAAACLGPVTAEEPDPPPLPHEDEEGWVRVERTRTAASWTGEVRETWSWDDQDRLVDIQDIVPCYCATGFAAG